MFIDNQTVSAKWMLAEVIVIVASLSLILWAKFHDQSYALCFTISGIGLLAGIIMLIVNPSYLYYNDEGKNIVIRTCSAFPLFRNYREYPFPKSSLVSFQIKKNLFGLQKMLSLKVSGLDPETKRPKEIEITNINVSVIKKETLEKLIVSLNKILDK